MVMVTNITLKTEDNFEHLNSISPRAQQLLRRNSSRDRSQGGFIRSREPSVDRENGSARIRSGSVSRKWVNTTR